MFLAETFDVLDAGFRQARRQEGFLSLAENFDVLDAGFRQTCCQEGFYLQQRTLTFSMPASGKLVARKAFIFGREL